MLPLAPADAALSPAERRMAAAIDADQARNEALIERLVELNSGTMNVEGVTRIGAMMTAELRPLGFSVRWASKAAIGRAGDVIAHHPGDGHGRRLLLIGHLDTVFEPSSAFRHFTRKPGEQAEGPGVGDDKGGMVTMLAALRAMATAGTLAGADITVVLTGDEEHGGTPATESKRNLVEAARQADVALDFEPMFRDAQGRDMGSTARRSSGGWTVTAQGRTGHSSLIFSPAFGDGAIYELARIVDAFRAELPEHGLTFNVGLMAGGMTAAVDPSGHAEANGKGNVIPATAFASGDLRALTDEQAERAMAKMRAIVARHLPGAMATIAFSEESAPALAATPGNRALLADLNAVNGDLGVPAMPELDPLERGSGDISYVARYLDCLSGLGAYTTGMHGPGETIDLASLRLMARRSAILMSRLTHAGR
jgi:glutamate carboxypeptidase